MKKLLYFIVYRILTGSILLDLLFPKRESGKEPEPAAPAPRRRLCDVKPGEYTDKRMKWAQGWRASLDDDLDDM